MKWRAETSTFRSRTIEHAACPWNHAGGARWWQKGETRLAAADRFVAASERCSCAPFLHDHDESIRGISRLCALQEILRSKGWSADDAQSRGRACSAACARPFLYT